MTIFTPIWGEKHVQLFEKALAMSLAWPKNNNLIQDAYWAITTDSQESLNRIAKTVNKLSPQGKLEGFITKELTSPNVDTGMILIETLKTTAKRCLKENSPMLIATPDFIYGDGTLFAFQATAAEKGTCASIAHMRVLPSVIKRINAFKTPSNKELVCCAFDHPHISWEDSDNRLYKSGLRKWKVEEHIYAVQHFMPSPFYINFLEEDLEHLSEWNDNRPPGFGLVDHLWPTRLIKSGRLRFIGSSDLAVMIEITDEDKNVPPVNSENDPKGEFFHKKYHNQIFSQFLSTFRGVEYHETT